MRFKGASSHYASDYAAYTYDEPELMPQTDAMRQFRLSLSDLKPLRVKLKLNPVDPRFAPMKLYRITDLQVRCLGRTRRNEGPLRSGANCGARAAVSAQRQREGAVDELMSRCKHRPARVRRRLRPRCCVSPRALTCCFTPACSARATPSTRRTAAWTRSKSRRLKESARETRKN